MAQVIVNADDYGMTPGVNRSIEELFLARALSSASVMAGAPLTNAAARFCVGNPSLGAGCHIVLVDGAPLSPPDSVRSLLAPNTNAFYSSMSAFMLALARGVIRQEDIAREAAAQITRLQSLGIRVDHVDTHKHTHVFPRVLSPLLAAAANCGVRAIRNPFEQHWSVRRTRHAGLLRGLVFGTLHARYHHHFRVAVDAARMVTTAGTIGILATGSLNAKLLTSLLRDIPPGTWEFVCHPGYVDSELNSVNTKLRGSRAIEHQALLASIPASGVELTTFGVLAG